MKHKDPQPPTPAKVVGIDTKFETATSYLRSTAPNYGIADPDALCDLIEALEHRCLSIAYALGYERANELHAEAHGKTLVEAFDNYQHWRGEAIDKHFTFTHKPA
jgi:hypothetical protein